MIVKPQALTVPNRQRLVFSLSGTVLLGLTASCWPRPLSGCCCTDGVRIYPDTRHTSLLWLGLLLAWFAVTLSGVKIVSPSACSSTLGT
jgi:hypothetical protein